MKIGIVCSAGGSACFSALDILFENKIINSSDVLVISDRPCQAENAADKRNIRHLRIQYDDTMSFSSAAYAEFNAAGCGIIFLFFTRLVSEELYDNLPTFNIHPSLLPAFPGFNALHHAQELGVRFLGATLHQVNRNPDAGPIIAQVIAPVQTQWKEEEFSRASYIQKTYLMLCMVDLLHNDYVETATSKQQCRWLKPVLSTQSANPCIVTASLKSAFADFQSRLGFEVFDF